MPWCCNCFGKSYEAPEVLELDYRHSSLTEVPPDVFSFERTLEKLCLASNQISDLPPSLFHCHELKELDLGDNELTSIPAAIGSLTRLLKLDASRNSISEVADAIKNCKNLTSLDLSLNHLVKLPEGISQLVGLEELNLNDTYLEFLHANFGRLVKLKVLELRENSLQSLPKSMTRFSHLQRLDVGQNDLHELPDVIGTMNNLLELWIDNNSLRSIPPIIGNLTKLASIDASCNDIIEIADEIGRCTHLTDLSFSQNSIEGLPDTFPKLECLSVLRLDNNQIQYLPEDFGNLKSLQELSILRNLLKALPPSIGLLRKLHTLLLDENLINELPKEIGSCCALTVLHVSKNRLHRIPSEIGHLSQLKVLALAGNVIIHLPVSILNIPKLGAIWLSESQSKPLLPLNKETDPFTGEHVLTCYLLPQLPSDAPAGGVPEEANYEAEADPNRPRRSLIKFAGFEDEAEEPAPAAATAAAEASQANRTSRTGLLRAPTPYPKELRALAKHASQIYSNTRQLNGDVVTDGAEYEAEANGDARANHSSYRPNSRAGPSGTQAQVQVDMGTGSRRSSHDYYLEAESQKNLEAMQREADLRQIRQRLGLGSGPFAVSHPDSPAPAFVPTTPLASTGQSMNSDNGTPVRGMTALEKLETITWSNSISPGPSNLENNSGSKQVTPTPPPYHVAARRAAFFRNVGSSPVLDPGNKPSPRVVVSENPLLNTTYSVTVTDTAAFQVDSASTPVMDVPDANATYIIESGGDVDPRSPNRPIRPVKTDSIDTATAREEFFKRKEVEYKFDTTALSSAIDDAETEHKSQSQDQQIVEDIVLSTFGGAWPPPAGRSGGITTSSNMGKALTFSKVPNPSSSVQPPSPPPNAYPSRPPGWEFRYIHPLSTTALAKLTSSTTTSTSGIHNQPNSSTVSTNADKPRVSATEQISSNHSTSTSGLSKIPVSKTSPTTHNETRGSFNTHTQNQGFGVGCATNTTNKTLPQTTSMVDHSIMSIGTYTNPMMSHKPIIDDPGYYANSSVLNNSVASSAALNNSIAPSAALNNSTYSNSSLNSRIPKFPSVHNVHSGPQPLSNSNHNQNNAINRVINNEMDTSNKTTNVRPSALTMSKYQPPGNTPYYSTPSTGTSRSSFGKSTSGIPLPGTAKPNNNVGDEETRLSFLQRFGSGSRIPRRTTPSPPPSTYTDDRSSYRDTSSPESVHSSFGSRIPTLHSSGRKPWIFGSHRNARVVPLEHKKTNSLGFTVSNAIPGNPNDNGVYVNSIDGSRNPTVKIGDKILQVDGIDVSNMSLEIVRKILSNCHDTINLLVSREN